MGCILQMQILYILHSHSSFTAGVFDSTSMIHQAGSGPRALSSCQCLGLGFPAVTSCRCRLGADEWVGAIRKGRIVQWRDLIWSAAIVKPHPAAPAFSLRPIVAWCLRVPQTDTYHVSFPHPYLLYCIF